MSLDLEAIKARANSKCPECHGWGEVSFCGEMVGCRCNGKYEPEIRREDHLALITEIERLTSLVFTKDGLLNHFADRLKERTELAAKYAGEIERLQADQRERELRLIEWLGNDGHWEMINGNSGEELLWSFNASQEKADD